MEITWFVPNSYLIPSQTRYPLLFWSHTINRISFPTVYIPPPPAYAANLKAWNDAL